MLTKIGAFWELTKPRALVMIVFTTCLSYLIALTDVIDPWVLFHTGFGVAVAAGGSLALNQHMERDLDSRMKRTQDRPIPSGRLSARAALVYGWIMMLGGYAWLWFLVNPLCSLATAACGLSYLYMYTPLKPRSSFSSFVGAIPGGLLPVMGWAAARGHLEVGAWVLFVILWLWQIPHALIISIRHREDYESVGMKQLPVISHHMTSAWQMVLNVVILVPVTLLPFPLNMTEARYPVFALVLGLGLLYFVFAYLRNSDQTNCKRLFISLSAYLPLLLLMMYIDKPA